MGEAGWPWPLEAHGKGWPRADRRSCLRTEVEVHVRKRRPIAVGVRSRMERMGFEKVELHHVSRPVSRADGGP